MIHTTEWNIHYGRLPKELTTANCKQWETTLHRYQVYAYDYRVIFSDMGMHHHYADLADELEAMLSAFANRDNPIYHD